MSIQISAQDVNKLRQMTGVGMMDCKKALVEANGDFEAAIDLLRKKGQKVAASRVGRAAGEGTIITRTNSNNSKGVLIALNCETDFVAKNEEFVAFANKIADVALAQSPGSIEELNATAIDGRPIQDHIIDLVGKIGEKIEISRYESMSAETVITYIHGNNKLGVIVGLNKAANEAVINAGKDCAMQIAAMSPVAVDKDDIDESTLARELEIAKDQVRAEGKPEEMVEKIAMGKLNKFFKESTLMNQEFVKDSSKTIAQMLDSVEKGLKVTAFKRVTIGA